MHLQCNSILKGNVLYKEVCFSWRNLIGLFSVFEILIASIKLMNSEHLWMDESWKDTCETLVCGNIGKTSMTGYFLV